MSGGEFTKGPWDLDKADDIIGADGNTVAVTGYFPGQFRRKANARLIAAAPDMFDALHAARDTILQLYRMRGCEAEGTEEQWIGFIDAALSRASGKEA